MPLDRLDDHLILGQYAAGQMDGQIAPGYREEPGVDPRSLTPTYALVRVFVDNWRWQGVPFYISSGKRLRRKVTRIDVQFKEVPHSLFRDMLGVDIRANRLVMGIHPDQDIFLNLQTKRPGQKICLRTVGLNFMYHLDGDGPKLDAYEKALTDVMAGDQTLFWRQDMLELCWAYFDPVLGTCEHCGDRPNRLHPYPAGSHGPQTALDLLPPGSWPEKP